MTGAVIMVILAAALLVASRRRVPWRAPVTHDYTYRGRGHDFTFTPIHGGKYGRMVGWGAGIRRGDFLLLAVRHHNLKVQATRYRVTWITYERDPADMWSATVEFAPR